MFSIFKKKKKVLVFTEIEINFFRKLINLLPDKYGYLETQINTDFILGFKENVLGYKDSYTFLLNAKLENKYSNKKLPKYFILKNIKIWNIKSNSFYDIELDILNGMLGGFKSESIDFLSFDLKKNDFLNISEKHFENKDLEKLLNNFNEDEKNFLKNKVNDSYIINLPEGIFYYIDNIGNGDIIALDSSGITYLLIHDPYEIKEIFTKKDFFEKLKNNTLYDDALEKYNFFQNK